MEQDLAKEAMQKATEIVNGSNEVLNGKHPWAFVVVFLSLSFFIVIILVLSGGAYFVFESVRQQDAMMRTLNEMSAKMEKMNKYLYWIDRGVTEDTKGKNKFLDK
jgi:hypothetical protein